MSKYTRSTAKPPAPSTDRSAMRTRAKAIWDASKGRITAPAIATQLEGEGYGKVDSAMLRVWKKRDAWTEYDAKPVAPTRKAVRQVKKLAAALDTIAVKVVEEGDEKARTAAEKIAALRPTLIVDMPKDADAPKRLEMMATSLAQAAVELALNLQVSLREIPIGNLDQALEAARIIAIMADSLTKVQKVAADRGRAGETGVETYEAEQKRIEAQRQPPAPEEPPAAPPANDEEERPFASIVHAFRRNRS